MSRCNRLDAMVDLGRADRKGATTANSERADTLRVDKVLQREIVDDSAESLQLHIRREGVARLALTPAPA